MNWIRYDLFTPLNLDKREISNSTKTKAQMLSNTSTVYQKETGYCSESCSSLPRQVVTRCPVHKHIRNHSWSTVKSIIRNDTSQITVRNRVGWSSLILAVYHAAPVEVIAEMLSL